MYKLITVRDRIRVPPGKFKEDVTKAVEEAIREKFEGMFVSNDMIFLTLIKLETIGEGIIIPGDGAIYYDSLFKMLTYVPILHEVIEGTVTEITDFGAFVRMGPIDGLAHVSQVMDDYCSNPKTGQLQGRQSKKVLTVNDVVRAKIIAVSLKSTKGAKIGLTMRQPGLGKTEWIEAEKEQPKKKRVVKKAKKKGKK